MRKGVFVLLAVAMILPAMLAAQAFAAANCNEPVTAPAFVVSQCYS